MLLQTWPLILSLALLIQARGSLPGPVLECLTPGEKSQLSTEKNIDKRVKIYETASTRLFDSVQSAVAKEDFEAVPVKLRSWLELLNWSLTDIEESIKLKKTSKELIRFEIQLRKAILSMHDNKVTAPEDAHEALASWLNRAEEIRKRFVDILFQR